MELGDLNKIISDYFEGRISSREYAKQMDKLEEELKATDLPGNRGFFTTLGNYLIAMRKQISNLDEKTDRIENTLQDFYGMFKDFDQSLAGFINRVREATEKEKTEKENIDS